MKRTFDVLLALLFLIILLGPMLILAILVHLTSPGPILHWSQRVGLNNRLFLMPKFRSMRIGTPQLATHLLDNAKSHVTPFGGILRKTSLDELPQIWSVFRGDMSFIGPRPALFNQTDLIELRTKKGIHTLRPGITGWAQVNGRDEIPLAIKVALDEFYLKNRCATLDMKILFLTILKVLRSENIQH